jgi:hypothetical protein
LTLDLQPAGGGATLVIPSDVGVHPRPAQGPVYLTVFQCGRYGPMERPFEAHGHDVVGRLTSGEVAPGLRRPNKGVRGCAQIVTVTYIGFTGLLVTFERDGG